MTIHEKLKGEKRNIEWSQLSWNWMSGCDGPGGIHCRGCYAKCIARRLRGRFGYPERDYFKVVLHPDKLFGHAPEILPAWTKGRTTVFGPYKRRIKHPLVRRVPTVFFNVSMGDWMFAEPNWRKEALLIMKACPRHIFVTLTKQYNDLWVIAADSPLAVEGVGVVSGQLAQLLSYQIPNNVIVGISVTNREQVRGIDKLREVNAFTRMVCFEPLLEDVSDLVDLTGINWIIIGKRTRQGKTSEFMPEKEWVDKLIAKARELDIPVFLKPSMTATAGWEQIQETPYEGIRRVMGPRPQTMDGLIQKHVRNIPPPPRGRMCGSDGIY